MTEATLLEICGVKKRWGARVAVDGVDRSVRRQEVHAIVGENGAGKSTLMNILSASIRPDAGSIIFQGLPFHPVDPLDAPRRGIAHIHQELCLCPHLSVAENIFLANESLANGPRHSRWLEPPNLNAQASEL